MGLTLAAFALAGAVPFAAAEAPAVVDPFRIEKVSIAKATSPHEWPFSVDEGELSCIEFGGQRVVLFSEPWRTDVPQEFGNMTPPRSVVVSANPFAIFASHEDRSLYAPFDGLETLIRRLAPFEAMGTLLCEKGKEATP